MDLHTLLLTKVVQQLAKVYVNSSSDYGQIFLAESSNIALDNVNISTTDSDPIIVGVNGAILLMDSYIMHPFGSLPVQYLSMT